MPSDVTAALATPYASPLTLHTEVRRCLVLASAGLLILGLLFVGYALSIPEADFMGALISGVGVFMLNIAWVNFWVTRAGYPHLILRGHQLSVRSSDAFRRDLDLSALGETRIVVITGHKASQSNYLAFLPLAGAKLKPRPFVHQRPQPFAETVLLNGYIGSDLHGAKEIERVVNARRAEPRQELPKLRDDTAQRAAAKARLIATAAVFAAAWVALVWWRLLP